MKLKKKTAKCLDNKFTKDGSYFKDVFGEALGINDKTNTKENRN